MLHPPLIEKSLNAQINLPLKIRGLGLPPPTSPLPPKVLKMIKYSEPPLSRSPYFLYFFKVGGANLRTWRWFPYLEEKGGLSKHEGGSCVTQLMLYTGDKLSSTIFCLWVCQASVTPDKISTFSNIYRHTSPLLTMYHVISSSTNLNWPSTSQYRHILTQYHQVPLIIHHLMSHAQYTWSSFEIFSGDAQ